MGSYLWCALGAILGWVASRMNEPKNFVTMVESVAVGVFGAFLGGEFLPAMVLAPQPGGSAINLLSIAMAVGGAVACLLVLGALRRSVGPLKPHKKRRPT
ncbi:GlsB/YeaQ/YmgE family stress response membrane protein [Ramlibacter sp. PS4R-6]|uniref:GlsB/YeaQ/YmgE family stress response membrane protein n=1 Tax=Ramlibacter sp. PS4R-6 TaxID=3133438 RepID=UPI0030984FF1